MLHRLCEPPSIPLSFSLATILPRRGTYHFCFGSEPMSSPLPSTHRSGPGLPGYLIPFAPLAFAPQRQKRSSARFRHRRSFRYLRISPLHRKFRTPLPPSRQPVSGALPRLSRGISPLTWLPAYAPFKPSDSEQRSHGSSYRGCWHELSPCFLRGSIKLPFLPPDRALQPEGLHRSRGVARSGLRPLPKILDCSLP